MSTIPRMLESRTAPRFESMSAKREAQQRLNYLERYLQSISPRVSCYMSLKHERDTLRAMLKHG